MRSLNELLLFDSHVDGLIVYLAVYRSRYSISQGAFLASGATAQLYERIGCAGSV